MRKFFVLLGIIGLALSVAYPFIVQNFGGYELARFDIYSKCDGFVPVEIDLSADEAPVRVLVDFSTVAQVNAAMASAKLLMAVTRDGGSAEEEELEFNHSTPGENSVHSGSFVYRATGGAVHPVGTEKYEFSFSLVSGATLKPENVEMILMASAIEWDPRMQLIGYVLLAIGMVGFVISTVGKGKKTEIHDPQKWGRDGEE